MDDVNLGAVALMDIAGYLDQVRAQYASGQATEHSYRPALHALFESIDPHRLSYLPGQTPENRDQADRIWQHRAFSINDPPPQNLSK